MILSVYFPSPTDLIKHHQGYLERLEEPKAPQCKLDRMDGNEVNCGIVFIISVLREGDSGGFHVCYCLREWQLDIPAFLHNSELGNGGIPWAQGAFFSSSIVFKIINAHYIVSSVFLVLSIGSM